MRLNHLDLAVPDIAQARDFFEAQLGFTHVRTLGQDGLAILKDSDGLTLVLSRRRRTGAQAYPEGFHIGFHLADEAAVLDLHARLTTSGTVTPSGPKVQHGGAFCFYFTAPGGILVEVARRG